MTTNSVGSPWFASVKKLIAELSSTSVEELRLEDGKTRVLIRRNGFHLPDTPKTNGDGRRPQRRLSGLEICAPLAGIFYLTPSPSAPPLIKEGDLVEVGQVVGLVEAMKVFNEIRAEQAGRVSRILVESGQLVQKGQLLIEMEKE